MVTISRRVAPSPVVLPREGLRSTAVPGRVACTIVDLIEVVGNVRDGDHVQSLVFLAQEFGMFAHPHMLFGLRSNPALRPHSMVLASHIDALFARGIVERDSAGHLRVDRDRCPRPTHGVVNPHLHVLGALSPAEVFAFAVAVQRLARQGLYAGSRRHDNVFRDTLASHAAVRPDESAIDCVAVCAVRDRLLAPAIRTA